MTPPPKCTLLVSPTPQAQRAARHLRASHSWVEPESADIAVVLGGDGFLLQTLHAMLDQDRILPVFGMNLGTVGFMMNDWQDGGLDERIAVAKRFKVTPLRMIATRASGETVTSPAINEVSLLRETRQTAKLEVSLNGRVVIEELVCDGIIASTPAGSTAYNYSAGGPILPLGLPQIALTPISAFRPRRWRGAILPDSARISLRVLEPGKRPVSAVADQLEVRDVATVDVEIDRTRELILLFDPDHALDDRITMEQFAV